jgi:hypothetical protein
MTCSDIQTSGNNQGVVWIQEFLSANQFCVVNITSSSPDPLSVSLYQTRTGWNVVASNDTIGFSQTAVNITNTNPYTLAQGNSGYFFLYYTGTGSDSFWLETAGGYQEPACVSAVFMKMAVTIIAVVATALTI